MLVATGALLAARGKRRARGRTSTRRTPATCGSSARPATRRRATSVVDSYPARPVQQRLPARSRPRRAPPGTRRRRRPRLSRRRRARRERRHRRDRRASCRPRGASHRAPATPRPAGASRPGVPVDALMRASIPRSSGSRPASPAPLAHPLERRGPVALERPGRSSGTSRRRGARSAGAPRSDEPPIQIGIGRCTGSGFRPAAVILWSRPSKSTHRLLPEPPQQLDLLLHAAGTIGEAPCPSASYSTGFQPCPIPRRNRPPVRMSTSAACFATSAVWRCGRMTIPVTSSSVGAIAAR